MDGLQRVSENLEIREAKRKSIKESILSLLVQWNEFEGHLEVTHKDILESVRVLESREKDLQATQESLESARKSLEQKEKDFLLFRERKMKLLELKEQDLALIRENYGREVGKKFSEKEKRIQALLAKMQHEKLELEKIKDLVEKRLKEIGLKEKYFEDQRKEIELIRDSIEKRANELKDYEGKVKDREKKVEQKEKELNERMERGKEVETKIQELGLMIENIEFKERQIDFIRELNEKRLKELGMKENELQKKLGVIKEKEKETKSLIEEHQDLESRRKREYEDRIKKLGVLEKDLELKVKELETLVQQSRVPQSQLYHHHHPNMRDDFPNPERIMEFEFGRFKRQRRFLYLNT